MRCDSLRSRTWRARGPCAQAEALLPCCFRSCQYPIHTGDQKTHPALELEDMFLSEAVEQLKHRTDIREEPSQPRTPGGWGCLRNEVWAACVYLFPLMAAAPNQSQARQSPTTTKEPFTKNRERKIYMLTWAPSLL